MNKKIEVKCPLCKKQFEYHSSKWRPFCSNRCKQIDLGHWVSGNYSISSKKELSEEDLKELEKGSEDE